MTSPIPLPSGVTVQIEPPAPPVLIAGPPTPPHMVVLPVQGIPGPQGPGGAPFEGTAWFYGAGPPDVVIGSKVGDFYVDTVTGTVYELQQGG